MGHKLVYNRRDGCVEWERLAKVGQADSPVTNMTNTTGFEFSSSHINVVASGCVY